MKELLERRDLDMDIREAIVRGIKAEAKVAGLKGCLNEISEIRDSIIGLQTINWSEHIYPLVAVLKKAGLEGAGYKIACKKHGTMLERTFRAEAELAKIRKAVTQFLDDTKSPRYQAEEKLREFPCTQ